MQPASAQIDTLPSSELPIKINGPLLITGYSFSGHSLNYVQIYNSSSNMVSIEGWKVGYEYNNGSGSSRHNLVELYGKLAPRQYMTVGSNTMLPTATLVFTNAPSLPTDQALSAIVLTPPLAANFSDEIATPSITASTIKVATTPSTYYFMRTTSASTGNYNAGFSAFIPSDGFNLASDGLYEPPNAAEVTIVEIYPDAPTCGPTGSAGCSDYVKLFNGSNQTVDLSKLRLRTGSYGQSSTSSNTVPLNGVLAVGEYVSFPITLSSSASWVWLEDVYGTVRYDSSVINYPSSSNHDGEAWSYNQQSSAWEWTAYPQPGNVQNQFAIPTEVNMCNGLIVSEVAANVASEDQFIEIMNTSTVDLKVDGCVIQTNRSTINSFLLSGILPSGGTQAIYIKDTPLTLTKTTSGAVYILSSDKQSEISSVDYENLAENTSLALVSNVWLQTYAVTPNAANIWQEYPLCDDGYFRNIETGYCNKVQTIEPQADCDDGKYRNPETNRCRNIETVSALLTPCASNQVRNPETNRCRNVASVSSLQPCASNQERNPETNRCRSKTAMIEADFPVEAVGQASEATLGWWAFGGVGVIALGYAGWEWRNEMLSLIKKVASFIPSRG